MGSAQALDDQTHGLRGTLFPVRREPTNCVGGQPEKTYGFPQVEFLGVPLEAGEGCSSEPLVVNSAGVGLAILSES